jgi:melibiose permease/lactose/raffinose/galactose permease
VCEEARVTDAQTLRNRFGFGLGTVGRDAAYTLINLYLLFYLSDVLRVSTPAFAGVTIVLVVARLFDAVNDPFMGVIVDNTRSRYGKFKPWILGGLLLSTALMIVMFTPMQLGDAAFIAVFAVVYLAWEISYTANDIGYWSMLPALSQDQKEREKIGSVARICSAIGAFTMVIAIVPVSTAIGEAIGDMRWSYFWVACGAAALMLVFQLVMLVLVREDRNIVAVEERTRFRDLVQVIFRNDQLMAVTISLALFMTAFTTTINFGIYYFRYVYGDENVYAVFALVLGVSQITALALYPVISRLGSRRRIFTIAISVVAVGYVVFFLAPPGGLAVIVVAGVAIFAAQAVLQLLMLMFITDTVEYGQHKFGRRNDSVTLSLQPFIYKLGSALASGIVGWTVIASGMKDAGDAAGMTDSGVLLVKTMMLLAPVAMIVVSYLLWLRFYRLDEGRYAQIVEELRLRREAQPTGDDGRG